MDVWCVFERLHLNDRSPMTPWTQFYQRHVVLGLTEVPCIILMTDDQEVDHIRGYMM